MHTVKHSVASQKYDSYNLKFIFINGCFFSAVEILEKNHR